MKSDHRASEVEFDTEFLLVLVRGGDESALGRLLERYRNDIGLLIRIEGSRPHFKGIDADGLIREIGLEIRRRIATIRGSSGCDFLEWVRRMMGAILANRARHHPGTRCRRRRQELEEALINDLDRSSTTLNLSLVRLRITPNRREVRCEPAVIVADALGELPEAQREVIILRNLERIGFPDVARRMGCTEVAAKNEWLRALARLHRILEPSG